MGILPAVFKDGDSRSTLGLVGDETIDIRLPRGVSSISPRQDLTMVVHGADGSREVTVMSRLDTDNEIAYFQSGGILQYVLNNLVQQSG
jgi:aconitate hydratase